MYYSIDTIDCIIRESNDVNALQMDVIFTKNGMMRPYLQDGCKVFKADNTGKLELIKECKDIKQAEHYFIKHCLSENLIVSENMEELKSIQADLMEE